MDKPVTTNKNLGGELMYHFKEEHRLRMQAEVALEKSNRNCLRHQQLVKEYRTQIENLNSLIHDFLCQRSKLEQVVIERNEIKDRYEEKFTIMEREMNELKKELQHKKVSLTDQRVAVFREKIHCLEEENEMLHDKLWMMKRRYVDKSVSTDDLERIHKVGTVAMSCEFNNRVRNSPKRYIHSDNPENRVENLNSILADSKENSDDEVSELLSEWKQRSIVIAEQKKELAAKLQQLEDERNSESVSSSQIPYKNFEYTTSISSANCTPARTINSHDDEVFLPSASVRPKQTALTEMPVLELKCAGLPPHIDVETAGDPIRLERRDESRHCSSLDSILLPLNGRTVEMLTSDDSYDPENGLLNEHLYNLPDHKLLPAVRENLIHIRLSKYGDDVLTQSAPSRISLIRFVRNGGYCVDERKETEAIDSFNFLKDFSEVSSEPDVYTNEGSP